MNVLLILLFLIFLLSAVDCQYDLYNVNEQQALVPEWINSISSVQEHFCTFHCLIEREIPPKIFKWRQKLTNCNAKSRSVSQICWNKINYDLFEVTIIKNEFYFTNLRKKTTWFDAQTICRKNQLILGDFEDVEVLHSMKESINITVSKLNPQINEKSSEIQFWVKSSPAKKKSSSQSNAVKSIGKNDCAYIKNGVRQAAKCRAKFYFICQLPEICFIDTCFPSDASNLVSAQCVKSLSCPKSCVDSMKIDESADIAAESNDVYGEKVTVCGNNYFQGIAMASSTAWRACCAIGMKLSVINTQEELACAVQALTVPYGSASMFWVSPFKSNCATDSYSWCLSDAILSDKTPWLPGYPDVTSEGTLESFCTALYVSETESGLVTVDCDKELPYLCQGTDLNLMAKSENKIKPLEELYKLNAEEEMVDLQYSPKYKSCQFDKCKKVYKAWRYKDTQEMMNVFQMRGGGLPMMLPMFGMPGMFSRQPAQTNIAKGLKTYGEGLTGVKTYACGYEYLFTYDNGTWDDIFEACDEQVPSLRVNTEEDLGCLMEAYRELGPSGYTNAMFWTSGIDINCEGKFSWCSEFPVEAKSPPFFPGQPDNAKGSESCLAVSLSPSGVGGLHDVSCDTTLRFVCKKIVRKPNCGWYQCPKVFKETIKIPFVDTSALKDTKEGMFLYTKECLENKWYFFSTNTTSLDEARDACSKFGMSLFIINAMEKVYCMQKSFNVSNVFDSTYWVNGVADGCSRVFKWCPTGQVIPVKVWDYMEPNDAGDGESCVMIKLRSKKMEKSNKSGLHDVPCKEKFRYICEAMFGSRLVLQISQSQEEKNVEFFDYNP